jgi:hypothetical protein
MQLPGCKTHDSQSKRSRKELHSRANPLFCSLNTTCAGWAPLHVKQCVPSPRVILDSTHFAQEKGEKQSIDGGSASATHRLRRGDGISFYFICNQTCSCFSRDTCRRVLGCLPYDGL